MATRGRVYSVNISKEKGISKEPVPEANIIENFGLEGDVHAGDEIRQVSLLSIESIRKQKECIKLKKEPFSLKPGDFAENITTEGIELSKLKIGDTLRMGADVILEVSKIGKECHTYCVIYKKLGTCIMPKEGIFTRVLKGGRVRVGDCIEIEIKGNFN